MVVFELWAGETTECSEPIGLSCGRMEDKNIESSADSGAWLVVPKGSEHSTRTIYVIY